MSQKNVFAVMLALTSLVASKAQAAGSSASATADAKQVVESGLSLTKTADLDFGTAVLGDGDKTVASAADNAENANFSVQGEPGKAFTVTLPSSPVTMINGAGADADHQIVVDSFSSNLSSGNLDGSGAAGLIVGAHRAAIGNSQASGAYVGSFTVTVAY